MEYPFHQRSTDAFYEEIDASNLGYGEKKSTVTWSGNLNCNVNIAKGTVFSGKLELSVPRQLTPQGENFASFVTNVGVRPKNLSDEKISLIATTYRFRTLNRKRGDTPALSSNSFSSRDFEGIISGSHIPFWRPS